MVLLGASCVYAQTQLGIEQVSDQLGTSLTSLKNSADKLSVGNGALTAKNDDLKKHLNKLQTQFQKLADENNVLTKSAQKLQDIKPVRAQQIAELEKSIFELDEKMDKWTEEIKTSKAALVRSQAEDLLLTKKLGEIIPVVPVPAPKPVVVDTDRRKEKLRILKMVYQSKERQEDLYSQVNQLEKQQPVIVAGATAEDKQALLDQIKRVQDEIDQLTKASQPALSAQNWSQEQMAQLDKEVKDLQKNRDELEDLLGRMQQKAQKVTATQDQRNEQVRLRASLEDLNKQGESLRANFKSLSRTMVELNKRKAFLEATSVQ